MGRLLLIVSAGLSVCSCARPERDFAAERFFAMGTWVDVTLESPGDAALEALATEIESFLRGFEQDYYAWGDGELAVLNGAIRSSKSMEVTQEMADLLRDAQRISRLSHGYFEPGVGALVELWGFHSSTATPAEPSAAEIGKWLRTHGGIADLRLSARSVSSDNAHVMLDLGGIAKGVAVDRIIGILRRRGIDNAIVNAGGDLRAVGTRKDRQWRVGIKAPRAEGILGYIELADGEAAFTSGDYERFFDAEHARMHHLLDPVSGYPATHTQAVTVIAGDGTTADAAATAVFVAGRDDWREVAADLGVSAVLRVDRTGAIEMTDEMRVRLRAPHNSASGRQDLGS
jgi:thiamine biosynthesis lipoprotein